MTDAADWAMELEREAIEMDVAGRAVRGELLSPPPDRLAERTGLLLAFSGAYAKTLNQKPYNLAVRHFLDRGHRALSLDMPNHGSREDKYGEGILGIRNAFVHGHKRFTQFVKEGTSVLDQLIDRGIATSGRIAVSGTSRGGYAALRLLAGDIRIVAGAGFAPVTDWRFLSEFADDVGRDDVAVLRLHCFTHDMAGRAVFLAIGHDDRRVNTASCCQLYLDLLMANIAQGQEYPAVDFYCTTDEGHTCSEEWYERGAAFLLKQIEAQG